MKKNDCTNFNTTGPSVKVVSKKLTSSSGIMAPVLHACFRDGSCNI